MKQGSHGIRVACVCVALVAGLALTLSVAGGASASSTPVAGRGRTVDAQILSINSFQGQITAGKTVGGRNVGSAAVLASYLRNASKGMENDTVIVETGDLIGAGPAESALLQDEPTIMFFNMLGNRFARPGKYGVSNPFNNLLGVPGNHEFDEGVGELKRLLYGGNYPSGPFLQDPWKGAAFPMVCSNVVRTGSNRLLFDPYCIKLINGERVAFVGAVLRAVPTLTMPSAVAGLTFLDEADSINKQVARLKRMGVRSFIVVLHKDTGQTGYVGPTNPLAPPLTGDVAGILSRLDGDVDVVIAGNSNGFANTYMPNAAGKRMLVVQAWWAGTAYADIDLKIDRVTHDIVSMSARVVTTYADEGPGLTPDRKVAALVRRASTAVAPLVGRVVGTAASTITASQNAAGESPLGNLVADAQRAAMGTDFCFMNPGGVRTDINAGSVTWGDLYSVQPFGNALVKMDLTGQQIYDALDQQWAGQPAATMLQISGLTYAWDNGLPVGDRVTEVRKGGVAIDKAATYTVTVNNFLAAGGDNFEVFTLGADQVIGPVDLDALITYISSLAQPFNAAIEGRIARLD